MKLFCKVIFVFIAVLSTLETISAEEVLLNNVKDFDPTLLIGKTCQGGWTNEGGMGERGLGASIVRFTKNDNLLTAKASRRFGRAAFEGKEWEKPFEDLGVVQNLSVNEKAVTYSTSSGSTYNLTFEAPTLKGRIDLTNNLTATGSSKDKEKGMKVELVCS